MQTHDAQLSHSPALGIQPDADAQCVERIRSGEVAAFETIMRRHNQRLYRLAMSFLDDASESQDVLQESYVRAFHGISALSEGSHVGAWLARIVRNEAIDRLRARTVRKRTLTLESDLNAPDEEHETQLDSLPNAATFAFDPENAAARDAMRGVVEQAIRGLPPAFRTVFVLREVEGLSVKEVADYLDIPAATVKTRDHRARLMLRERLEKRLDAATMDAFAFMGTQCDNVVATVMARIRQ